MSAQGANVRQIRRGPAKRPKLRTVTVHGEGDFEEWECTARADFPARVLSDLQSGSVDRIIKALDTIIVEHNFPTSEDTLAETMADVDPSDALFVISGKIFDAIAKLPNR